MPLAPGVRLGNYEIQELLGSGGMGEVYRARDPRLGRDIAIKILPPSISADPERIRRFEQEARATAALNHPNILAVYDIGSDAATTYVVSELLDGETLRGLLAEQKALPLRKTLDYAIQIARGLAAAHGKGIVHRDLKPENLFITTDGHAKILDFGLAKLQSPGGNAGFSVLPTAAPPTEPGMVMGTVGYMSPEQVRGRAVDHRSDIFSFGAVLYEMVSGHRAFVAESPAETMTAIVKNDPPELSTLGRPAAPGIERIILRCLEKAPDARFQSAKDLAFALEALSSSSQPSIASATRASISRRERLAWIVAGVTALVAASALVVPLVRQSEPVPERVLRFTIPWPPDAGMTLGSVNLEWAAISPNGKTLAFMARSAAGSTVWIRDLDSFAARQLPGTETASNVFWSPDSRYLGVIADGGHTLKKIDLSGGPPTTIANLPAFTVSGGSWNQFGDIILGSVAGPVFRVSDQGGEPTPVTVKDAQKNELGHRWPQFLPDGRHFLFFATYPTSEVTIGSLDGDERVVLLRADSRALYAPPGYLIFVRQGVALKQPFDPATRVVSGDAIPIAERVLTLATSGSAGLTVSNNGVLVYLTGRALGNDRLAWFSRTGEPRGTIGSPGDYRNPRLSPDGKRVIVDQVGLTGSSDVWILDLGRGATTPATKLTDAPLSGQQAVWSPDGSRVAYAVGQPGPATIYQKLASGIAKEEMLTKSDVGAAPNDWTAAGLLYHKGVGQPPTSLILLDPTGKEHTVVEGRSVAIDGRFSPDGKWLAYVSSESGRGEVYLQNYPAATLKFPVSAGGGIQPVWRRDGKELFYLAPDGMLMAVSIQPGNDLQIGAPQALFQTNVVGGGAPIGGGIHHQYDVSPDGQQFLVLTAGEREDTPFNVIVNWPAATNK